ncbi:MAG: hypothetical protein JNJ54_31545 [Myxococcaceae bacterium]|nr:hypothetical protein [Myxococcaceae bacterium]
MSISKGSERVKAWIYVVINPWCEALEVENQLLASGNTTFRWTSQKLEYVRTVAEHLSGRSARLILDDLTRGEPGMADFVKVHDEPVRELELAARDAHRLLSSDAGFRVDIERLVVAAPNVVPKMETSELVKWAAQRVINNGCDASERWQDYAFWVLHQGTLLTHREQIPEVTRIIGVLRQKNEWLLQLLTDTRNKFVESYDVPPAFVA